MSEKLLINQGERNQKLYEDYRASFHHRFIVFFNISKAQELLISKINVFFSDPALFGQALEKLEQEVKFLWDLENTKREKTHSAPPLTVIEPAKYHNFIGLQWPDPEETNPFPTNNLLAKVLLAKEQQYGINFPENKNERPVPTFVGVVAESQATQEMKKNKLWSEDLYLSPLPFHSKQVHRIQFYALMVAIEMGIIDLGMTEIEFLKFITTKADGIKNTAIWNFIFDSVAVGHHPAYKSILLTQYNIKPTISDPNNYSASYVYGTDPYFVNSFLMTIKRKQCPHLATLIIEQFRHAVNGINQIEKKLGFEIKPNKQSKFFKWLTKPIKAIKITDYSLLGTLERLSTWYYTGGGHAISPMHVLQYHEAKDKGIEFDPKNISPQNKLKPTKTFKLKGYRHNEIPGLICYKKPYVGWSDYVVALIKAQKINNENYLPYFECALRTEDNEVITALFQHGINPNQADKQGVTPLLLAILAGKNEVVELLLQQGAKAKQSFNLNVKHLKDFYGKTLNEIHDKKEMNALQLAEVLQNQTLIEILTNTKASVSVMKSQSNFFLVAKKTAKNDEQITLELKA